MSDYYHKILLNYIHKHGNSFPKKHGNWIKLKLFKDYYLSLDSWNGYISFCKGKGEYDKWLGYGKLGFSEPEGRQPDSDKRICFLGGNMKDCKPTREETLKWIVLDVLKIKIYE